MALSSTRFTKRDTPNCIGMHNIQLHIIAHKLYHLALDRVIISVRMKTRYHPSVPIPIRDNAEISTLVSLDIDRQK